MMLGKVCLYLSIRMDRIPNLAIFMGRNHERFRNSFLLYGFEIADTESADPDSEKEVRHIRCSRGKSIDSNVQHRGIRDAFFPESVSANQ